jgi:hypothetical protein
LSAAVFRVAAVAALTACSSDRTGLLLRSLPGAPAGAEPLFGLDELDPDELELGVLGVVVAAPAVNEAAAIPPTIAPPATSAAACGHRNRRPAGSGWLSLMWTSLSVCGAPGRLRWSSHCRPAALDRTGMALSGPQEIA